MPRKVPQIVPNNFPTLSSLLRVFGLFVLLMLFSTRVMVFRVGVGAGLVVDGSTVNKQK